MMQIQTDIIAPISAHAIYLHCTRNPAIDAASLLQTLRNASEQLSNNQLVLGLGASLLAFLEVDIPGMRRFPDLSNSHIDMQALDIDLWIWLKAEERGELFHLTQKVKNLLAPNFEVNQQIDAYQYQRGSDLTGYEDGTENPQDEAALECAFVQSEHVALNGSSMVAVQQWQHSFAAFHAMSETQQDHMIGRRLSDNEELDDAPESAHVKRTAQESFTPEAFILRRSMPWSSHDNAGLYFTAFGKSFDAFEAQLRRMLGLEDGIVDALFQISTPMISSYFWCPPMQQGRLNLSALVNSENLNR